MTKFDVIIVGAGISGCICALELQDDLKILLIDAGKETSQRICQWEGFLNHLAILMHIYILIYRHLQ